MIFDLETLKDQAFLQALEELKMKYKEDQDAILKLESIAKELQDKNESGVSQSEEEKKPHQSDAADGNNSLTHVE